MKPRSLNHPGVRAIIATLDRLAASPDKTAIIAAASVIAELGDTIGRFESMGTWWSVEGVRAMLITQAQWAPGPEFRVLVRQAKKQREWIEWWDAPGGGRHQGSCNGCPECRAVAA